MTHATLIEDLQRKLKALDETLWERRAQWPHIQKWVAQFAPNVNVDDDEQLQMLFLASHFMYFGLKQGAVAGLVGNEGGVVSEVINLESSGVEAPDRRPRHDEHYHEA